MCEDSTMMTPTEDNKDEKIRTGMVQVSDGKSRPRPARLVLSMDCIRVQQEVPVPSEPPRDASVPHTRERMVQITRQKQGGLGLSIKGGAEHKLPILISKIYKDQAADQTGQLFVGDAVIKVNGEYITACAHDDAVTILRNAGDIVVLTVKHYRAATPFLQKQDGASDTESMAGDDHPSHLENKLDPNRNEEKPPEQTNGGWQSGSEEDRWSVGGGGGGGGTTAARRGGGGGGGGRGSRPGSAVFEWRDVATVPLMMGYVTRYVFGTDKLRPGAFEVRGALPQQTSGVIHVSEPAALSAWLKSIADNIVGLTNLQMKLLNRSLPAGERVEYMGWAHEGVAGGAGPGGAGGGGGWQVYTPRFLLLRGTALLLYNVPPMNTSELNKFSESLKVYATMFRVVKESETVDWRQHCFLLQASAPAAHCVQPRYFSAETRRELLRLEAAWTAAVLRAVLRLGKKTFTVVHGGRAAGLTLDWSSGFSLCEQGAPPLWTYRFSQLRGSSDDGKSKLKLHFQDPETKVIETKELECQILQSLLFCMHAFLTAKVASVDPAFLANVHHHH